eukprot:CAMPEP_0175843146 /NCGR_PEP_ID=MMETSP0107_2-20121207/20925_1 /TAXON_ID=195067 ORGANISM="Goniomonas pacifica, Strain CCMP1869" /NCGR_SAMPLE_ID=MMETSP0107_2 /ASSEMBLY_ACC=CAM_ASM_000203 /LENGTH=56 /DNA_ID=CAMNT_0017157397 /DNA_START=306 /DNA_END=473 /DNA_ORIENTATION=-
MTNDRFVPDGVNRDGVNLVPGGDTVPTSAVTAPMSPRGGSANALISTPLSGVSHKP